ncbi:MAG: hypothetical protein F6J89_04585 [Symploca sp. SIO1C4]|uniref:Uncharacterized protein n=1 Tax=Symploca sp. SIO1C4 TaxID=2607765 RepID=A0A6B3NB86_9CYAN|nr:hypothetical protein [Symploca sp. SIO1C4]
MGSTVHSSLLIIHWEFIPQLSNTNPMNYEQCLRSMRGARTMNRQALIFSTK